MSSTASSMGDALIATLEARQPALFSASNVTKNDFGLLDLTSSGCVFVILPGESSRKLLAYGNPASYEKHFNLLIKCYVRDSGNSVGTLNLVWQAEKDLNAVFDLDDTLGGSAMSAFIDRSSGWNGETFVQSENVAWIPIDFNVRIFQVDP